ncbi:MAG: hypothetical protein JRG71_10440 [Deltaproteobacteria bacterium]|nr:hypothetical protein [Deltaproteobacteria bacterium]
MKRMVLVLALVLCFFGQVFLQNRMQNPYDQLPQPVSVTVLPLGFLTVASLEYRNLVADMFFLQVLTLFGETLERGESKVVGSHVKDWEWQMMLERIELATSLDPLFLDPYYFANAIITQRRELVPEVIALLEKGSKARDWDWELPFYAGFNYFYILNEPQKASQLLMEAAQRPTNKSTLLTTLAARLAFEGKETENAILFLRQMLALATDEAIRKTYATRLKSLEGIYIIEKGVELYRQRYARSPEQVSELVAGQILKRLPEDPYGGSYYIDSDGSVKTTSNLRPVEKP